MKQFIQFWNQSREDIVSGCVILGTITGCIMLGIAIYELKVPQCDVPSTIAEVRDVEAGNQDESYLN